MEIITDEIGKLILNFNASNKGKFRFKTRTEKFQFGEIFSTRKANFHNNLYLEWQIGYDATKKDISGKKKFTKLSHLIFRGDNKKYKHPYELSEILYYCVKNKIINKDEIEKLLNKIRDFSEFIDKTKIENEYISKVSINKIEFEETKNKLPTFFLFNENGTVIEVSTQKQQYASGIQPMLYFCIPINSFINSDQFIGKSSIKGDILQYEVDKSNAHDFLKLLEVFATCSARHRFDVIQILGTILGDL